MKKKIAIVTTAMFCLAFLIVLIITSCKKDKQSVCKTKGQTRTQGINQNEQILIGRFYDGGDEADLSDLGCTESEIDDLLGSYELTLQGGGNPTGLVLYYSSSVDTTDLDAATPSAVLVYKETGGRLWAELYKRSGSSWVIDADCWGITRGINTNAIYDIINRESLTVQNIVLLQSVVSPGTYYFSNFDAKTINGVGGGGGNCKDVTGCPDYEGVCKSQGKGTGYMCHTKSACWTGRVINILEDEEYSIPSQLLDRHYTARDNVLNQNRKRAEFIDDYYYASEIISENILDLEMALSAYTIYQSNLIRKFANCSNSAYNDTILITPGERTLLLDFCDLAEDYSNDSRYQVILDSVEANINRLYNHTVSYVNSNF